MPSGVDGAAEVSVVVIGYAPAELLERCLAAVRSQAAGRDGVEVLCVAPAAHQGSALAPLRSRFPEVTWIEPPPEYNVARMRGLGVARSRGAVVAFVEGDCVPEPGWVDRLLALPAAAAVGGAVEPGAFRRARDWAAYLAEFATFLAPLPEVPRRLPGTNVAYRRDALPAASRLEAEGFYETFLQEGLAGHGGAAADDGLVVRHERRWRTGPLLAARFHHGRGYAALRTRGRPWLARAPYLALAAVLPPVLVARVLRELLVRRRLLGRAALTLPWLALLALAWSAGEFLGYAAGPGRSLDRWR